METCLSSETRVFLMSTPANPYSAENKLLCLIV